MTPKVQDCLAVEDASTLQWLREICGAAIDARELVIHKAWVRDRRWISLPSPYFLHENTAEERRIIEAADSSGADYLYFANIFHTDGSGFAQRCPIRWEALSQAIAKWTTIDMAVVPDNTAFIILSTPDYYVVSGPKSIAERIVNMSAVQAIREFENYIDTQDWDRHFQAGLRELLDSSIAD